MLENTPTSVNGLMFAGSLAFFVSVWLIIFLNNKRRIAASLLLGVGLVIWYSGVHFFGRSGFFAENPLIAPFILFAFIILFIAGRLLYTWPKLQEVFAAIPTPQLIAVQIFRLMGYGFLTLWAAKVLPGEFAIPTGIGDILIGSTAPIVAVLVYNNKGRFRNLAIWWNYLGIADLVMAIFLGILTFPRPFQLLPTEISNEPIALFPLVLVPVFAVPLSLFLHLFAIKGLKTVTKSDQNP